jgi:hypothetical protein
MRLRLINIAIMAIGFALWSFLVPWWTAPMPEMITLGCYGIILPGLIASLFNLTIGWRFVGPSR